MPVMTTYLCCFLDRNQGVGGAETIEADELSNAIDKALAMLQAWPHHQAVELWEGGRRVYPPPQPR
jgi:hypothetical protein